MCVLGSTNLFICSKVTFVSPFGAKVLATIHNILLSEHTIIAVEMVATTLLNASGIRRL